MRSLLSFLCAVAMTAFAASAHAAGTVDDASKLIGHLNKIAKKIVYTDEDEFDGEPYTATILLSFELGETHDALVIGELYSETSSDPDDEYSASYTLSVPLRTVHVRREKNGFGYSNRTKRRLAAVSLACDDPKSGCIRRTYEKDKTWSAKGRFLISCEPENCKAIEQDLKQLVALARGTDATSDPPATLVERLNELTAKLRLTAKMPQGDDTLHMATSVGFESTLVAEGKLQVKASGKIDGQLEKSGKQSSETIEETVAIPLRAVTVKLNPQVIGRTYPDEEEVQRVSLACELKKRCIRLTKGGKARDQEGYSILCANDACTELETVLQKLVAAVRLEPAKTSEAGETPSRKANKR
jgi:hypothetical protein